MLRDLRGTIDLTPELLDKIGPAIIQTHSAGGPFGWLVANERPALVKAVVCFEGAGAPLIQQAAPGTGRAGGQAGLVGPPGALYRTCATSR